MDLEEESSAAALSGGGGPKKDWRSGLRKRLSEITGTSFEQEYESNSRKGERSRIKQSHDD